MAAITLSSISGSSIEELLNSIERQRKDIEFIMENLDDDNIREVSGEKVVNLTIDQAQIRSLLVDTANIKDLAVSGAKIANATITTANIADAAITNAKIDRASVNKLVVVTADIKDAAITNAKIDRATVNKLVVTTADIADANITNAKIDRASVNKLVVVSADIQDAAIITAKINDAAITTAKIGNAQITTALIQQGAIIGAKIADATIDNAKIVDATITGAKIASATIGTANIGDAQITTAKINNLAVGTAQIADAAITNAKIGLLAVGSANIIDASIVTAKIADLAVGTAKIADAAITTAKVENAAITNAKIDRASVNKLVVTTADIQDAAITNAKIDRASVNKLVVVSADIQDAAILTAKIADAQITSAKIGAAAIETANIKDAAITTAKIGTGQITTGLIKDAAITTALINDLAVTDAKINSLTANKLTAGTIDASKIAVTNLVADNIVTGTITLASANLFMNTHYDQNMRPSTGLSASKSGAILLGDTYLYMSQSETTEKYAYLDRIALKPGSELTITVTGLVDSTSNGGDVFLLLSDTLDATEANKTNTGYNTTDPAYTVPIGSVTSAEGNKKLQKTITLPTGVKSGYIRFDHNGSKTAGTVSAVRFTPIMVQYGKLATAWQPHTNELLAAKGITNLQLGDSAVDNRVITANTITGDRLIADTITGREIAAGSITANKAIIANAAIGTAQLIDAAITTAKIGDAQITTAKIANAQITSALIADAQITNAKIDRASANKLIIVSADIQDAAITNAKIDRASVNKLVVGTADIADAAITNAKILNLDAAKITTGLLDAARVKIGATSTFDSGYDPASKATPADVSAAETRATKLAKAMSIGKMIHTDPTFMQGVNSCTVYNNNGNGVVTVTRIAKPTDAPTNSTHVLEVKTTDNTASPGYGGFIQGITGRASAKFVVKIIAKIPVGYELRLASNSMGTGYTDVLVTPIAGTGKYEEYIRVVECGTTGTFSTGGHIYLVSAGGANPTPAAPLTWYVAYCTAFDITDNDYRLNDAFNLTNAWKYSNTTYIDGGDIYTGTVTANQIAAGTITAASGIIADATIGAAKIIDGSISTAKIADAAITNAKIESLDASKITTGLLDAARVKIGAATTYDSGYNPNEKVSKTGYVTPNSGAADYGKWTKIGEAIITVQYAYVDVDIAFTGGASGANAGRWANIHWRVKQQNALGQAPYVSIEYLNGYNLVVGEFKAVTVENTATKTRVELYVMISASYEQLSFQPTNLFTNGQTATWFPNSPFTASLPAGTQTSTVDKSHNPTTNLVDGWKYSNTTYIDGGEIYTNSITANQIASRTITANQIAAGTITANEIAATTITADKLSVTSLSAISADLGTVTAGTLRAVTLEAATGTFTGGLTVSASGKISFADDAGAALNLTGMTFANSWVLKDKNSKELLRAYPSTVGNSNQKLVHAWGNPPLVPTLMNGWVAFGAPYAAVNVRMTAENLVYLYGVVKNGLNNDNIFYLPAGYKPEAEQVFVTQNESFYNQCKITIKTNGAVFVNANNNTRIHLDGIVFMGNPNSV